MDALPAEGDTIRSQAGIIFFVFTIFFINMLSRLGMAPLLPGIEAELGLRHVEAGSLFLFVSVGYGCGLFTSPFISARMAHPHLIVLSSLAVGASLFGVAFSTGLNGLRASWPISAPRGPPRSLWGGNHGGMRWPGTGRPR